MCNFEPGFKIGVVALFHHSVVLTSPFHLHLTVGCNATNEDGGGQIDKQAVFQDSGDIVECQLHFSGIIDTVESNVNDHITLVCNDRPIFADAHAQGWRAAHILQAGHHRKDRQREHFQRHGAFRPQTIYLF